MTTAGSAPATRSAFTAAFLSFLFPGLGQAYAGAYRRGLILAVPPVVALLGLVVAFLANHGLVDFGLWIGQTSVLGPLAVFNIVLLAYRAVVSIDAYRLAVQPAGRGWRGIARFGTRPGQLHPLSTLGLVAVLTVMTAGHAFAGYWDLKLYNAATQVFQPPVIETPGPSSSLTTDTPLPVPTLTLAPNETLAPAPTIAPWTGTNRLNILLVGYDAQGSGFRTDSMIVVSIDPTTHRVALFSVLRDVVGLPLPPKSRVAQLFGPYFGDKLTNLWEEADPYRKLFPNGGSDALKQALSYTFFGTQNSIQYYIAVGFQGFEKVVDALGGVTINVPAPVFDNGFPGNHGDGQHLRVYFPAGIQHMNGEQALTYARVGHVYGSSVYDRTLRQQQLVVALEQQANFDKILANMSQLVDDLGKTVHTDIPEGPDVLGPLISLARTIKPDDIKSYVWATSHPDFATIRQVVKSVIAPPSSTPDLLQLAVSENAPIVIENGTGTAGQDTNLATYLQSLGLNAQAAAAGPAQPGSTMKLICLNGADKQYPNTLSELQSVLRLSGTPSADPMAAVQAKADATEPVGFLIVTGTNTPNLTPAPD